MRDDTITIHAGDIHSKLSSSNAYLLREAARAARIVCRSKPSGYMYTNRYRKGGWDGFVSLMVNSTTFPTGLLGMVCGELKNRNISYNVVWTYDRPVPMSVSASCLHGITLYDYQVEASEILLKVGRGIAKMATNSGKTEVMAAVVRHVTGNCVIFTHKKDLLYQTADRISSRLGEPVGKIGDGVCDVQRVTVATIQSVHNHPSTIQKLQRTQCLFIDECHHGSSDQMQALYKIPGSYRFGVSGTPLTYNELNDMRLIAMTGRIVYEITNRTLIDAGYSADVTVHMHVVYLSDDYLWEIPYHQAYAQLIVDNDKRNAEITRIVQSHSDSVVLIIVKHIRHGELLQALIPGSTFVNGAHSTEHRQQVLNNMRCGVVGAYIATNIFDEGVDVPSISVLIMAAGDKAERTTLQRIGRGLRKKVDGGVLVVHDFFDDTNKHLLGSSQARMDTYEQEGFQVEVIETHD